MKKLTTIIVILATCLFFVGCGATESDDSPDYYALLESQIAKLKTELRDSRAHNALLEERIELLETEPQDVQKGTLSSTGVDESDRFEEREERQTNYKWGEYPDFVYADDVLDYWLSLDCNEITVLKPRQVDIYTGGDSPSESWEVDSDIYVEKDGRGGMWYFEDAGETCLLLEDSVVRLLPGGETEVFLDNVVGYGGWDCLITVYQLCDGTLSLYEQTSGYEVTKRTIATEVSEVDLYLATFSDPMLFRKNDGAVYYFDPYDWGDDVAPEELGLGRTMNMNRLLNGDTSVFISLGSESLEYYHQWIEDYREKFIAADDPDMLYPIPALLAEFAK